MNTDSFVDLFDESALLAIRPMFVLAIGILGVLLAGVVDSLRITRTPILVGALIFAFLGQVQIATDEPGLVLAGALQADRTTALWGAIFVIGTLLAWLFSRSYYDEDRPYETEHDVLMLTTPIGMMLMAGGAGPDHLLPGARAPVDPAVRARRLPSQPAALGRSRPEVLPTRRLRGRVLPVWIGADLQRHGHAFVDRAARRTARPIRCRRSASR